MCHNTAIDITEKAGADVAGYHVKTMKPGNKNGC